MADSLFDDRYRYDYIYPRGRSGETLRAVDTHDHDRPVVIKRPAPNDAPPIRAGQEVSILNERKALLRLAGQPALTELLGAGQFFVGGVAHQYIVMERAEGDIVADAVLELAKRGERLPELEMLVIIDRLLELLSAAHRADIVYNDVDTKHLFWHREKYRLKMIDWGNAVFLEGDESTPQGVSRQSDIFQMGELLYFILSGGGRADVPRDAGDDFRVDFGRDTDRVHSRLQSILSRALHPNPRLRYASLDDLRRDLADYRIPLERERDAVIGRVEERLKRNRSKDELQSLLRTLEPALAADPGHPGANRTRQEILNRLSDLEVEADLDAARIYLESGNWLRAVSLLEELRPRARGDTAELIGLLLDWARLLLDIDVLPTPPAILQAIGLVFERKHADAALLLLTHLPGDDSREEARQLQWLMAERISARVPEVLLLRPNLYRLEAALVQLTSEQVPVNEPLALLGEIQATLDAPPGAGGISLIELRDRYRVVVDGLSALGTLLEAVNSTHHLPNRKLPLSALTRALNAAMSLADNMHVIGRQATASPRDALAALDSSRAIDPPTPLWTGVESLLNGLYQKLESYQQYVPNPDGADIGDWLKAAHRELQPYADRLFDEMLVSTLVGLDVAMGNWDAYARAALLGNRDSANTALNQAVDAVSSFAPRLAGWLGQLRDIVAKANYIERHALFGVMGRALADGWEAFDRGKLGDAEQLGKQAYDIARDDSERFPARRLRDLSDLARNWIERNGISDSLRTQAALNGVERLFTADENSLRSSFNAQMPSKETYLRAMGKGLVEHYARSSSGAVRILYVHFILNGALDAHEDQLEDAEFWREAAVRCLGEETGRKHPAARTLDEFIARRRDLIAAAAIFNKVDRREALATLANTRKQLEANGQARLLTAGVHSLRELETSLRDWSDGEFHAAAIKLENAVKALDEVEKTASFTLTGYRAFLIDLLDNARVLHEGARRLGSLVDGRDDAFEELRGLHIRQVDVTRRLLGDAYAPTLTGWLDTYESFLDTYTNPALRRSARLTKFNDLFRALYIDRHPAYPLYRHWYEVTETAPEFPAPPTDEPTPRLADDMPAQTETDAPRRGGLPRLPLLIGVIVLALGGVALLASGALNSGGGATPLPPVTDPAAVMIVSPQPAITNEAVAVVTEEATALAAVAQSVTAAPTTAPLDVFITPTLIPTSVPIATNTDAPQPTALPQPTESIPTAVVPAQSDATATDTIAPSTTPTFTPSPRPTLPEGGLQGRQDLLAFAALLPGAPPWSSDEFSRQTEENTWRLGVGSATGSTDPITIRLPADLLEAAYGGGAAARIRNMQVTLTLTTYDPTLVEQGEVYFGALIESAADPTRAVGLYAQLSQPGVVNLGQRQLDGVEMISQRSFSGVIRVRLERDPATGAFTLFYDNQQLGQPIPFIGATDPIVPALYVRSGGMIVSVTDWTITLR
jgi:hypothetical protein